MMTAPKQRRRMPSWVAPTAIILIAVGIVAAIVIGIVLLVLALTSSGEPGPGHVDASWQCTEFGDRLYWPTNASRLTFTVVPGGCRNP